MKEKVFRVGSLFAGIGGIDRGFESTGRFKTVWFVENDRFCQAVLRRHWPFRRVFGDIKTVDWLRMPKVDVLVGGSPCQDLSDAGRREGITGEKSSLWKEYAKAIRILRPKVALLENVAAIAHRGLDVVIADLAQAGYDAEYCILCANDVGAPHKRARMFVVATRCFL